ncbi:MAG TPA: serine/threonine-protein kinase, partial [Gemmatimonadaceae bacterium]
EDAADPLTDLDPGTTVARYVILRRRARGGMATVYEAERSDGVYQQRVALKILRRGLDTEDLIRRFLAERQILSSLAHPNIARLLDGGSTDEGRPFLVMDLVEGQPITTFADTHGLEVGERLELFLGVVDAVHAAHRQLVVHRDIKPSNILVDGDGAVKLLDFGIAKLLVAEIEQTEAGARALTPEYAAPEQLSGEPITTATDVYQLGLLLGELLTGVRPAAGRTLPDVLALRPARIATRTVEGSPDPEVRALNRGVTPAKLSRQLSGDLEIILRKALRPEPEQRYASANEFGSDIRRYLKHLPVVARPESAAYRMRKFVRRHRRGVAVAIGTGLLLIAYAATVTVQRQQIAAAGRIATREARTAEQVTEFLTGLFQSSDPRVSLGDTVSVLGILDKGAERLRTELADQPEVRAALLLTIGRAYTGLGRFEKADTLLSESLQLRQATDGSGPRAADVLRALGNNSRTGRDFAVANEYYSRELALRSVAGAPRDTAFARVLQNLSYTQREIGSADSALALIGRSVELRRSLGDTLSPAFVDALGTLAFVLRGANRLDSAEAVYNEAIRRQTTLLGADHYEVATLHNNLGYLLRIKEDFAGAEREYREAIRIARIVFGDGHPSTMMFKSNLAGALIFQSKFDEVEAIGRDRIVWAERQWPDGHWRVGAAYAALGRFLVRYDRASDPLPLLRKAIAIYSETRGADDSWTVTDRAWYGTALIIRGHTAEGNRLLSRSLEQLAEPGRNIDADVRDNIERISDVLGANGHQARAAAFRTLLTATESQSASR